MSKTAPLLTVANNAIIASEAIRHTDPARRGEIATIVVLAARLHNRFSDDYGYTVGQISNWDDDVITYVKRFRTIDLAVVTYRELADKMARSQFPVVTRPSL